MERIEISLSGLSCGHCVASARKALLAVKGVRDAEVTLDPMRARVAFDPGECTPGALVAALESEGYGARPVEG